MKRVPRQVRRGRLLFLRGLVVQGSEKVASFTGTIRKSAKTIPQAEA